MLGTELLTILPELIVAAGAIALLMYGVFAGNESTSRAVIASALMLALAFLVMVMRGSSESVTFANMVLNNSYTHFMKLLVLLASGGSLLLSMRYIGRSGMNKFEFPILYLFATVGMLMMVSANDLISLYMGLELQSLSLYVLAAFRRDTLKSTEAGLKYFVLGALSSGMLLYGASLIYGFVGTTNFIGIASTLSGMDAISTNFGVILGLVFVAAGLAFKVSAVPFHMWTPDVYDGAPLPVTAFFATAPKLAALALLTRVMMEPFGGLFDQWQQIIVLVAVASMVLAAFAAIFQTRIKRLMAYSSIGHIGFALVGLAAGTQLGISAMLVYLTIYLFMNLGFFACLLALSKDDKIIDQITDLAGLSRSHTLIGVAMAVFLFSMAGIPFLAGFFGKLYVFKAAVDANLVWLAVVGLVASVFSAFYYLRIIKTIFFDAVVEGVERVKGLELNLVIIVCAIVTLLFFVVPGWVEGPATTAAGVFQAAGS